MQRGFILDYPDRRVLRWVSGKPESGFLGIVKIRGKEQRFIETFRCATCGYLESYARVLR